MDRWEYKTVKFHTKGFWGGILEESSSREVVVVFKRKKEEIALDNKKEVEYCPACGAETYATDKTCRSCGITLIVDEEHTYKFY